MRGWFEGKPKGKSAILRPATWLQISIQQETLLKSESPLNADVHHVGPYATNHQGGRDGIMSVSFGVTASWVGHGHFRGPERLVDCPLLSGSHSTSGWLELQGHDPQKRSLTDSSGRNAEKEGPVPNEKGLAGALSQVPC